MLFLTLKITKKLNIQNGVHPAFFRQPIDQVWHWCINDTWELKRSATVGQLGWPTV